MGSIAVVVRSSSPPEPEVALRMLAAAPHRGTAHETLADGDVLLGVANRPDHVDAWLAGGVGLSAALSGSLDNEDEL
ncbi:MAG: hypothetical protein ACRDOP_06075, partial [Gaiellaceae bacterium]